MDMNNPSSVLAEAVVPQVRRIIAGRAFDSYDLVAFFPNLAAGSVQTVTVNVPANADLLAVGAVATVVEQASPGTAVATPPATLQVAGTGNDRFWFSAAQHLRNFAGANPGQPGVLTPFRLIAARSSVSFTLSHLVAGGTDYTAWISLKCVQVFNSNVPY